MKIIKVKKNLIGNMPHEATILAPLKVDENGTICKTTPSTTCRESLVSYLSTALSPKKIYVRADLKAKQRKELEWVTQKARVIFAGRTVACIKNVERGGALNVLHMLEKDLGLPETTCDQVIDNDPNSFSKKLMFTGHNKWIRSPHTFSLWVMLIRMGLRDPKFRVKSWDALNTLISTYPTKDGGYLHASHGKDKFYTRKTAHNWLPLMKNLNKVFPSNTPWVHRWNPKFVMTNNGTASIYASSIGKEGIFNLSEKTSKHTNAERFYALMAKEE